jgi:hypothetical protein
VSTMITFQMDREPFTLFGPNAGDSLVGSVVPLNLHDQPAGQGTVVAAHVEDGELIVTMEVTGEAEGALG